MRASALLLGSLLACGCSSVVTHASLPLDRAAATLTVEPYWTTEAGEDLVVSGLVLELWLSGGLHASRTTSVEGPTLFGGLPDGTYRLRVLASEREVLATEVPLVAGQSALVRIDLRALDGVDPGAIEDPLPPRRSAWGDFVDGLGDFLYYVGMGILIVGVAGLAVVACQPGLVVIIAEAID